MESEAIMLIRRASGTGRKPIEGKPSKFDAQTFGFTLTELLIVILIIFGLTTLLVPAVRSALGKAKQTTCMNNLRQLGTAFQLHAEAHDDKFPESVETSNWVHMVAARYSVAGKPPAWLAWSPSSQGGPGICNPTLLCPSDNKLPGGANVQSSFGSNKELNNSTLRMNTIPNPSTTILILDVADDRPVYIDEAKKAKVADRHNKGADIVFVDGHTGWREKNDIPSEYWQAFP
jgi:prepilin-type processing-associated H-X9-DG protein